MILFIQGLFAFLAIMMFATFISDMIIRFVLKEKPVKYKSYKIYVLTATITVIVYLLVIIVTFLPEV